LAAPDPIFLSLADVAGVHVDQIEQYGGRLGVRDWRLLQSAIAMPMASFAGEWLHRDLFEMASAYAFHISQNHPFFDGNKRTGLACALVFLRLNGVVIGDPEGRLYGTTMSIATGEMDKYGAAAIFRSLATDSLPN
jgi:death-on-curing protein